VYLGRVIGRMVATHCIDGMQGERLLIVQPVDEHGEHAGATVVACDSVDSGPGDLVHVCDGRESTLALAEHYVPVDATIVGHVEQFDIAIDAAIDAAIDGHGDGHGDGPDGKGPSL